MIEQAIAPEELSLIYCQQMHLAGEMMYQNQFCQQNHQIKKACVKVFVSAHKIN
jgi:hypothetical protein